MKRKFFLILNSIYIFTIFNLSAESGNLKSDYYQALNIGEFNKDSASILMQKVYTNAIHEKDTTYIIKSLLSRGFYNSVQSKYATAINYYFEASYLAGKMGDTILIIDCYGRLARIFEIFKRKEETIYYYRKAHELTRILVNEQKLPENKLQYTFMHLSRAERFYGNTSLALKYIDSCLVISDKLNLAPSQQVNFFIEKGKALIMANNLKEAEFTLQNQTIITEESTDLSNSEKASFLVLIYQGLGTIYTQYENFDSALVVYEKCLKYITQYGRHLEMQVQIHHEMGEINALLGNYRAAYAHMLKSKDFSYKFYNASNTANQDLFDLKNHYEEEMLKKDRALMTKSMELITSEKQNLRFTIFLISLILVLLVVIFTIVIRNQRIKSRQKEKNAKVLLEQKNKELTQYTLQHLEMEELISQSVEFMKTLPNNSEATTLLSSLKKCSGNNWEEFNKRFNSVYVGFYDRLMKLHPTLSANNLKICALIKLNFTSKEIAGLLGISSTSVDTARHRLRVKLGIDPKENLSTYIAKI